MKKGQTLVLDKEVIQQLSRRSDLKGLAQLTGHLSLLVLTTVTLAQSMNRPGFVGDSIS